MKTEKELLDILEDWLATYVGTCPCSQAHGKATYDEAAKQIREMPVKQRGFLLGKFVQSKITDEALEDGATWEDAQEVCEFIEDSVL